MTKSSVDRKRSKYGDFVSLRFNKPTKTYYLSANDKTPMLIAKFTEVDGDLAFYCWETFEELYKEKESLKEEVYQQQRIINRFSESCRFLEDDNRRMEEELFDLRKKYG